MIKNIFIGIAFVAGVTGLILSLMNNRNKVVYVEMGKIYEGFSLSKELNTELQNVLGTRKQLTDSLLQDLTKQADELKLQTKKTMVDVERVAKVEQVYLYKKEMMEKDNQAISANYNDKIWNQINQYIADYGKEKGLTLVLGANGQGNIMYGDETKNVTEEVIAYLNSRYNGAVKK